MQTGPQVPISRWELSAHRLIRAVGVGWATLIVTGIVFVIVGGIIVAVALYTGFPIWPGIALTLFIHLILLPQTYQTYRLIEELDVTRAALYHASITDELTQAHNRRYFVKQLDLVFQLAPTQYDTFSLALFDLDNFKLINDTYGHSAGDQVLRYVSDLCRQHARPTDLFARYGGEEFIFLLPATTQAQACIFAERIRRLVAENPVPYDNQQIRVTISIGVTGYQKDTMHADALLITADSALYEAKRAGKNQVVCG